jgi:hypothetical protein
MSLPVIITLSVPLVLVELPLPRLEAAALLLLEAQVPLAD